MRQDATKAKSRPLKDLYAECLSKESKLKALSIKSINHKTLEFFLFEGHPLFLQLHPKWGAELAKRVGPMLEERKPYDFSIIQQEDSAASDDEWRYRQLLHNLKEIRTIESRLLLIARWLKQEGICEPGEIMPQAMLRRALTSFQRKERISNKDWYKWCLVRIWIPYFTRLFEDLSRAPKSNRGPDELLRDMGYEPAAIAASKNKHSLIAAITSWLETPEKRHNARSLENAYSRVNSRRRHAQPAEDRKG